MINQRSLSLCAVSDRTSSKQPPKMSSGDVVSISTKKWCTLLFKTGYYHYKSKLQNVCDLWAFCHSVAVINPWVLNLPINNHISLACNGSVFVLSLGLPSAQKKRKVVLTDRRTVNRPSWSIRVFVVILSFLCGPSLLVLKNVLILIKEHFFPSIFFFFGGGVLVFIITKTKMGLRS